MQNQGNSTGAIPGCWEWPGPRDLYGYGRRRTGGKARLAHRVTFERAFGPVPDGMEIDHLCDNKGCVRPYHLQAVTHQENMRRATLRRRMGRIGLLDPTVAMILDPPLAVGR